jgi:hypothetical protein
MYAGSAAPGVQEAGWQQLLGLRQVAAMLVLAHGAAAGSVAFIAQLLLCATVQLRLCALWRGCWRHYAPSPRAGSKTVLLQGLQRKQQHI